MFNFLLFSFFLSGWLGADRRWRWGGAWGPPPQISVGRNTSFLTQRQAFFPFSVFVFLFYLLWSLWGATPPSWHNAKHFLLFLFFFPLPISVGCNTSFFAQPGAFFTFFSSFDLSGAQHLLLDTTLSIFYFFCFLFFFFSSFDLFGA